jgi:hypothetical protein
VTLPVFALYAATACRTVGPGDSGELTAVMTSWGVAHPPGYPLISLLGNLVNLLPFPGEPAFLLNLMSALFAALACGVLVLAVLAAGGSAAAAVVAGLTLGASRVFWEYALVVEVFSLNALFGALLLWLFAEFLRSIETKSPRFALPPLLALVAAQALTHHLTLVLVAVPVGLSLLWVLARPAWYGMTAGDTASVFRRGALVALVGLLPLAYVPIAASLSPPISWGEASTPGGFLRLLARSDYGSGTLMSPAGVVKVVLEYGPQAAPGLGHHILRFFMEIPRSLGWLAPLLAALGVVHLVRRGGSPAWRLFLVLFLGMIAVFFLRVNSPLIPLHLGVTERFYILPHVVIAFLFGLGASVLLEAAGRRFGNGARHAGAALLGAAAMALAVLHAPLVTMNGNSFTRDFGANFLAGQPDSAFVLSEGDLHHNAFHYQTVSLGRRPDLEFVDLQKLTYDWYVDELRRTSRFRLPPGMTHYSSDPATHSAAWLALNGEPNGHPVTVVSLPEQSWAKEWNLVPQGLWWRFTPKSRPIDVPAEANRAEAVVRSWDISSLTGHYHERSWETAQLESYWRALATAGALLQFRDDMEAGEPLIEPKGAAADFRALAERLAGPRRGAVRALEAETYQRLLTSGLRDYGRIGAAAPLVLKMVRLAEQGVELSPDDPLALERLADLLRADPSAWSIEEELALRSRLLDVRPGYEVALGGYVQTIIDRQAKEETRNPSELRSAIEHQKRYIALMEKAIHLSDDPALVEGLLKWKTYLASTEQLLTKLGAAP